VDEYSGRFQAGVKLQGGLPVGEGEYEWIDLDPSHCYIYNSTTDDVARLGSTSASILIAHNTEEADYIYRLVIWKDSAEDVNAAGVTLVNGTQITITKIE